MRTKTKIIATLGPSSQNRIEELIKEGVDIFRLNCSHADANYRRKMIRKIRATSQKLGTHTAVLLDISGPKIRVLVKEPIDLLRGKRYLLVAGEPKSKDQIGLNLAQILQELRPKEEIYFADGSIRAVVVEKSEKGVWIEVKNGGLLTSHKGANFPHSKLSLSALTPKRPRGSALRGSRGRGAGGHKFRQLSSRHRRGALHTARKRLERLGDCEDRNQKRGGTVRRDFTKK